ncbi:MAG: hypothetical protein IJH12_06480 [Clostridia bacterium]|nr:hypothetical protein [Clostridia bacterium]
MNSRLKLYSTDSNEILDFLESFYGKSIKSNSSLYWEKEFQNPLDMADFIAAFVDNKDIFSNTNLWVSIDTGVFINIKEDNYNYFIQYLFERYPY